MKYFHYKKYISFRHVLVAVAVSVFLMMSFQIARAFVEPSATPPSGNVTAPITAGSPSQTKEGPLTVNTDGTATEGLIVDKGELEVRDGESSFSNGTYSDPDSGNAYDAKFGGSNRGIGVRGESYFLGPVGIVDRSPDGDLSLDVNGKIGAEEYCDETGNNCTSSLLGDGDAWGVDGEDISSNVLRSGNVGIGPDAAAGANANRLFVLGKNFNTAETTRQLYSSATITAPSLSDDEQSYGAFFDLVHNKGVTSGFKSDGTAVHGRISTEDPYDFTRNRGVEGVALNYSASSGAGELRGTTGTASQKASSGTLAEMVGVRGSAVGHLPEDGSGASTGGVLIAYGLEGVAGPVDNVFGTAYGVSGSVGFGAGQSGTVTDAVASRGHINMNSAVGTIVDATAGEFVINRLIGGIPITTATGVDVDVQGATDTTGLDVETTDNEATSNYGIRVDAGGATTNNVGILGLQGDWVLEEDGNGLIGDTGPGGDLALGAGNELRLFYGGTESFIVGYNGDLTVSGTASTDHVLLSRFGGSVVVGGNAPDTGTGGLLKLDVEGNVGASQYCDTAGNNCVSPGTFGGFTGTEGSVPFVSSTGALTENNASLFWDNTDNRLGIGTAAPGYPLHIDNGTSNTDIAIEKDDAARARLWFRDGVTSLGYLQQDSGETITLANLVDDRGINFTTTDSTSTSGVQMVITGDGNIGIGDATPDTGTGGQLLLDVEGNIGASEYCDENGDNCTAVTGLGGATNIDELTDGATDTTSVFLGLGAGALDDGSNRNTGAGINALAATSSGTDNAAFGNDALEVNSTGYSNVAFGSGTLKDNVTGYYNTAVGFEALTSGSAGYENTAIGRFALSNNLLGYRNTAVGSETLYLNTDGFDNTAVGRSALASNTIGDGNTGLGRRALQDNVTGNYNTAVGFQSLNNSATGSRNVGIGRDALLIASSGSNNVALGFSAGSAISTGSNNVTIGNDVDVPTPTASNQLSIGNLIYGTDVDGTNGTVSTGNIGIGTKSPLALFHAGPDITSIASLGFANTGGVIASRGADQDDAETNVLTLMRDGTNAVVYAGAARFDMSQWESSGVAPRTQLDLKLAHATTSDLTSVLTLQSSGDVGIGDTTPDATLKLDVDGQVGATEYCDENGANCFDFGDVGGAGSTTFLALTDTPASSTAGSLYFGDGTNVSEDNANLFWDDANNRLGLGTVAPQRLLHLDGQGANTDFIIEKDDSTRARLWFYNDAAPAGYLQQDAGEGMVLANQLAGETISFSTSNGTNATRMIITGDGNIGIGDATPDTGTGGQLLLDVEGNIGASQYCDENGDNCSPVTGLGGATQLVELSDVNTATPTAGNFLLADGIDFESTTLSGDVTIDGTGIATISDNAVDGTDIAIGTTTGDTLFYDGTDWNRLGVGTAGHVLTVNAGATAPEWAAVSGTGGSTTFLGLTDTPGSSTAGSLYFGDGTNVSEDNANLFWDDGNDRLGIGTNAPSGPLHIANGAANTDVIIQKDETRRARLAFYNDTGAGVNLSGYFQQDSGESFFFC